MFYDQLIKLCKLNSIAPTTLVEKLGYSRGSLTNWKKGTTPNGDIVVHFSEYFKVTTDYFLLGKEEQTIIEKIVEDNNEVKDKLTFDEKNIINTYRELNDDGKTEMLGASTRIWAEYHLTTEDNQPENKLHKCLTYESLEKNAG